ncbi:MAG: adenosylcobinamide-GDP ribazoletransferase, partial [Methylophilaceae bacterium]
MKQEFRLFFTALMFFTRIPCARWAGSSEDDLNRASRYFPLVGVIVGLVAALVYLAAKLVFPQEVAVLASIAATLWLTGAFHEDGLADAADGLGGGWEKEQVLTIMQDSRLGSYGALAMIMALLTKFQTLAH